jgi:DNA-binding MarR family transcriptional regulator
VSREKDSSIDISNLILKRLEETELTNNKIVYSQRTAFVYGNEKEDDLEKISIEQFLIEILNEKGPLTRGRLASLTNIPRTTLYDVLSKLIMNGRVQKKPRRTDKRGRPKVFFSVKSD